MTQKLSSVNIETSTLSSFTGPTISSVAIANSTYVILDDTAVSNAGGYVVITGSNFTSGAQVLFGSTSATAVSFVNSTTLRVQVPALTAGSYVVYVQNADGSTAIRLNGITSSPIPVWSTGSTLTSQDVDTFFSISLSASSDSSVTYAVSNGSSLPSGTTLASNGLFSGTVTGISDETTYNFNVDAIDAENQETLRSFSVTISVGDQYYKNTTLHLSGETVNNTWISDTSTNKFIATPTGDAKPVSFSPYETVWSNLFDGTDDYLSITANSAFNLPGDFTMECWAYWNTLPGNSMLLDTYVASDNASYQLYWRSTGSSIAFYTVGDGVILQDPSSSTIVVNKWYHIAVTRSGTTARLFIDGVQKASATLTRDLTHDNDFTVGIQKATLTNDINGYISNVRLIKGTALYTSNFTPSTSPLTAVANTSLLMCHSNRFIDGSNNNFTITRSGDVTVSNFGPFTETDITTGSGYFDGAGDYLTVADHTSLDGFGDFTIECWVYWPSTTAGSFQVILDKGWNSSSYGAYLITLQSGALRFYMSFDGSSWGVDSGNLLSPVVGQWYHIAISRSGSSGRIFVNGTQLYTFTNSTTVVNSSLGLGIGGTIGGQYPLNGYISNVRIVKGTAVYTTAFTPPTSPLTAIANTSLLTLQSRIGENNNRFVDGSGLNSIITRNGNATQGTYSPFCVNGWSNYFDGTGDFLSLSDNAALNPGTSDFVMEAWVYIAGSTAANQGINGKGTAGTDGYSLFVTNARVLSFVWNGTGGTTITGGTLNLNQWHHVAVVRNDGVIRLYLDGVGAGSSTACTTDITSTAIKYVGQARGGSPILGYMSNYRMMKGSRPATYDATSSSLTVPVSPLTAISNTTLLTCRSNGFKDLSTNALSITRNGNASVQPFSPFKPTASWSANTVGGSVYFDGTGDWLSLANVSSLAIGTGDFTWESWIYLDIDTLPTFTDIYDQRNGTNGVSVIQPVVELTPTNGYAWYVAAANRITSGSAPIRQRSWQHLAVCRSGTTTKMFIDGLQVGVNYTDTNNYPSGTITIGRANDGVNTRNMTGYLSGLRVINGSALYTANTSPPTAPPTPVAGTTLLLNCTEGAILDYTGRENLETVGDARLRNNIVKYGNNSIFFDGTGDYLLMPSGPDLDFGTGDFTIEMWVNFTNATSAWQAIISRAYGVAGGWRLYKHNNDNQLRWYHNTTSIVLTTNSDIASGVWSHIAAVRNNGTLTLYINGTNRGSASDTNSYNPGTYALEIGSGVVTSSYPMTGYIDDLRITKGVARYTANFTPPTTAFKTK